MKRKAYVSDVRVQPACDFHLTDCNIKRLSLFDIMKVTTTQRQIIDLCDFYRHVGNGLDLAIYVEPVAELRRGPDVWSVHDFLHWS